MPKVTFDLATKVVAKEQVIWAVFPGKGRQFLETFRENNVIFLDIPGSDLTPAILENDDLLRKHLAMSEAIGKYARFGGALPPNRNAAGYEAERAAGINSTVGIVRGMYQKMKVGDLVLIGGQSLYEPFFACEIIGPFDPTHGVLLGRYNERVPVRDVRWLNVRSERRVLSQRLSHLLSNRNAVITIPKLEFGDEIYRLVYHDFVFGDDGRYVFPGPRYNNIARSTIPGIDLLSYFIAAYHASEEKEMDEFAGLEIGPAIENYFEQDILHSFELEFASPGEYVIYARRAALALITAILVAATSGNLTYAEALAATVVNSADHHGAGDPDEKTCPVEIQEKYREIMKSLGAERFNQLCKVNQDAQAGVGLKTNVKTKKSGP